MNKKALLIILLASGAIPPAEAARDVLFEYDSNGNLTKEIRGEQGEIATSYSYDALNRRAAITDAAGGVTQTKYNALDQMIEIIDPRALSTKYVIDPLNEVTSIESPDTGIATRQFDSAGRLITSTDAKGNVSTFTYDAVGRVLTQTVVPAGGGTTETLTFTYGEGVNGKGRLTSATISSGPSMAWTYDSLGRLLTEKVNLSGTDYTTRYGYDSFGRLQSVTYPSGRVLNYAFDANGQIAAITQNGTAVISSVQYQPFGPVSRFTFGNGAVYLKTFDTDGLVTSYTALTEQRQLVRDALGRISSIGAAAGLPSVSVGYDAMSRITTASSGGTSNTYTYDADGNRTSKSGTSYSYPSNSNHLQQAGTLSFGYDANGSTISSGSNQFTYNALGRMASAITPTGTFQYQLDAMGKRRLKSGPNGILLYFYDNNMNLIAEASGPGAFLREYIYLGTQPVQMVEKQAVSGEVAVDDTSATLTGPWETQSSSSATGGTYRLLRTR